MARRPVARMCLACEAYIEDLNLEVCPVCGEKLQKADSEQIHFLTTFEKDGREGAVDPVSGLVYYPAVYEGLRYIDREIIMIRHNGKWAILDHEGKPGFGFDDINDLSSNHVWDKDAPFPVENEGRAGFVTREGEVLVPCIYDYVLPFRNGLAEVSINNEVSFLDKNGEKVDTDREKTFEHVRPRFSRQLDGTYRAIALDSAGLTYLSRTGLAEPIDSWYGNRYPGWRIERNGAYIELNDLDGMEYLCSVDGPWTSDPCRCLEDLQEGRALFTPSDGTGIGFLDEQGDVAVPPIYSQASGFYEGKALVRSREDDCYYFIDRDGNKISDRICEGIIIHYHHPGYHEEDGYFWFSDSSTGLRIPSDIILDFDLRYALGLTDFTRHEFIPDIQYIDGDRHRYLEGYEVHAYDASILEDTFYKTGTLRSSGEDGALALYDDAGRRVSDARFTEFKEVDGVIAAYSEMHPVEFYDYQGNILDIADRILIDSEEFRKSVGRTLLLDVHHIGMVDIVDDDTGELIPVKRRYVIVYKGTTLSEEDIDNILSDNKHEEYAYFKKKPVRGSEWQLWYRRTR